MDIPQTLFIMQGSPSKRRFYLLPNTCALVITTQVLFFSQFSPPLTLSLRGKTSGLRLGWGQADVDPPQ